MSTITTCPSVTRAPGDRLARLGQPPVDDFDAGARYVSTDQFLVSHLGASMFGAVLGLLT